MRTSAISVIVAGEHAMNFCVGDMAPRTSCALKDLSPAWRYPIWAWRHE
jgi:hypothetical protein